MTMPCLLFWCVCFTVGATAEAKVRVAVVAGSPFPVPPSEGEIVGGIFGGGKTVVYFIRLGMAKAIRRAAFRLDPQWIDKI